MQLAFETSTNICSVAFKDGTGNVYEKRTGVRGSHSEQLFLFVKALMEEHDFGLQQLQSVIVSEGPGSYTGLRISASAVKGLLFGSDVQLYAANTLASFAVAATQEKAGPGTIHSIIDARRVHLYHQKFKWEQQQLRAVSDVKVVPIEQFEQSVDPDDTIVGTGINRLDKKLQNRDRLFGKEFITATSLFQLIELPATPFARQVRPEEFSPKYYTSYQG